MDGWIKIYRQMIDWEWYKDSNVKSVFLHLLLLANHDDCQWKGQAIKRGQLVTSYSHLSRDLGLSIHQVRLALRKLKMSRQVSIKTTNKYTLVTIEKYSFFQDISLSSGKQDGKQNVKQDGKQTATNKNDKNNIIYLYINKIKEKKIELEKDHSKFGAIILARKWILEQPDFLALPEEEQLEIQRRIMLEV